MKKLTALFTIVAMLVCMFTFAPTASAAEMYGPNGETVSESDYFVLSSGDRIYIDYWITCNNGWFDGTNGSDYVEAGISSSVVVTGSASVDATATYIYDGELVSQDALGNINYGYFGTFCNIPKMVLIAAGGFAQWRSSREVNLEFWYTINDDPRDTFRVLQGIDIYNLWH